MRDETLARASAGELARIRGVLFDLDDTVLTHGVLTRRAYDALWSLRDAGLRLVAVTGRPSAWGEVVARQWPVDAAITENGAVLLRRSGRGLDRVEACLPDERRERRERLEALVHDVAQHVPEVSLTDDVHGRISDVTWDVGERVTLGESVVRRLVDVIAMHGARSTRSSVHVHATFDGDDKASGVVRYLVSLGEDATSARFEHAFIGDSGNDAACFAAFDLTVGVANVAAHLRRLVVPPRYVTEGERGEGFAEFAHALLTR
ncbi:MAG: HAD-IIB family hydrolase [Polyangiaceae bacterium]